MKKSDYDDMAAEIKSGKVIHYNGRTAASVEELDFIKSLPDSSDDSGAIVTTYKHEAAPVTNAVEAVDEVGQKAQDFNPKFVASTPPGEGEPGPTAVNAPGSTSDEATGGDGEKTTTRGGKAAAPAPLSAPLTSSATVGDVAQRVP